MRTCRLAISTGLAICLFIGCGSSDPIPDGNVDATGDVMDDQAETDAEVDTGADAEPDTTPPPADTGTDVEDAAADVPVDAPVDAPADLPLDMGVDAAADTGVDVGVDAGVDVSVDVGVDAAVDVGVDAAVDVGVDAVVDVGVDTAVDVGVDTATDVSSDAVAAPRTLTLLSPSSGAGNLPDRRRKAGVAYDPQGDRMLIYAGQILVQGNADEADDVWAYDLDPAAKKSWIEIKPTAGLNGSPFGRFAPAAFVDVSRNRLIVGGGGMSDIIVHDSWYFDLTPGSEMWVQISPDTGFYGGDVLAYDAVNDRVVRTGDAFCAFDDGLNGLFTSQIDLPTDTPSGLSTSGTAPSFDCGLGVHDPINHRMVVIGGSPTNSLHQLSLTAGSETWGPITAGGTQPPTFTLGAAAVATNPDGHAYMYVLGTTWNEIWRLDLTSAGSESWTQIPVVGTPPTDPRGYFGLIHDASRNRLVIFGGASYVGGTTYYNDVWEISNID